MKRISLSTLSLARTRSVRTVEPFGHSSTSFVPHSYRSALHQFVPDSVPSLYKNGYQFGKFVANIGPQTKFPIPRGVIDTAGKNTIALSIWGMSTEKKDLAVSDIYLTIDEVIQGGVG